MKVGAEKKTVLRGHPITYGITIPTTAPAAAQAEKFLAFLLGERGQKVQRTAGFRPLLPAGGRGKVPEGLRGLVKSGD